MSARNNNPGRYRKGTTETNNFNLSVFMFPLAAQQTSVSLILPKLLFGRLFTVFWAGRLITFRTLEMFKVLMVPTHRMS